MIIIQDRGRVIEEDDIVSEVLLWENLTPTVGFDNQTITLTDDYTNYDYLRFCFLGYNNGIILSDVYHVEYTKEDIDKWYREGQTVAGSTIQYVCGAIACFYNSKAYARHFRKGATGNNTIYMPRVYQLNGTGTSTTLMLPYQIIGVKKREVNILNPDVTWNGTINKNSTTQTIVVTQMPRFIWFWEADLNNTAAGGANKFYDVEEDEYYEMSNWSSGKVQQKQTGTPPELTTVSSSSVVVVNESTAENRVVFVNIYY